MDREIMFRGRKTDGSGWVNGIPFIYCQPDGETKAVIIQEFAPLSKSVWCLSVDPATVGQYTGLSDANREKIFKGDVIRKKRDQRNVNYIVEWYNGGFVYTSS